MKAERGSATRTAGAARWMRARGGATTAAAGGCGRRPVAMVSVRRRQKDAREAKRTARFQNLTKTFFPKPKHVRSKEKNLRHETRVKSEIFKIERVLKRVSYLVLIVLWHGGST